MFFILMNVGVKNTKIIHKLMNEKINNLKK